MTPVMHTFVMIGVNFSYFTFKERYLKNSECMLSEGSSLLGRGLLLGWRCAFILSKILLKDGIMLKNGRLLAQGSKYVAY